MKDSYVYILSNSRRTVLYTGVTTDLERRILDHKVGYGSMFTAKYKTTDLLYYEEASDIEEAIVREKQIKKWKRDWKWKLIGEMNPQLIDLAKDWFDELTLMERKKVHEDASNDQIF